MKNCARTFDIVGRCLVVMSLPANMLFSVATMVFLSTALTSSPAAANKVVAQHYCVAELNGQNRHQIKWTWQGGGYAFETSGVICIDFSRYVQMGNFFVSYYCPDGIQNQASCYQDDYWRSSVIKTTQTADQKGTHYQFLNQNGSTWWATRWRLY